MIYELRNSQNEVINTIVLDNPAAWPIPVGCTLIPLPDPDPPAVDVPALKSQRLAELAALRYQHETAGITLSGMTIETDRQSQALITGAWSISQINPAILIDWKGVNGWVQIDAATITAIAGSVAGHVQTCFSQERIHAEAIAALTTPEAVQAYDLTTGWPLPT